MNRGGRRRGAYTQAERVLELIAILRGRRAAVRLDALAGEVGVSVKQLRRDLAVLAASGHRPELVRVEGRSAVQLARGKSESITLTLRERFALLAIRDVFASLEGTPLAEDAKTIFDKVAATLPDATSRSLSFRAIMTVRPLVSRRSLVAPCSPPPLTTWPRSAPRAKR